MIGRIIMETFVTTTQFETRRRTARCSIFLPRTTRRTTTIQQLFPHSFPQQSNNCFPTGSPNNPTIVSPQLPPTLIQQLFPHSFPHRDYGSSKKYERETNQPRVHFDALLALFLRDLESMAVWRYMLGREWPIQKRRHQNPRIFPKNLPYN